LDTADVLGDVFRFVSFLKCNPDIREQIFTAVPALAKQDYLSSVSLNQHRSEFVQLDALEKYEVLLQVKDEFGTVRERCVPTRLDSGLETA
jgi:hypothetical protein